MSRVACKTGVFAAIAIVGLSASAQADGVSDLECAKIRAAFTEFAEVNLSFLKLLQEIALINLQLLARQGAANSTNQEISAALDTARYLDGSVVGEGFLAFRGVCPND